VHCKGIACGHGNGENGVFFRDCDIFAFWGIYIIEHVTAKERKAEQHTNHNLSIIS
jgi:hypothetical protein